MTVLPSLTVVIPAFNAGRWLEPTIAHLDAALDNSPWAGSEIVVVNDGSTDDSAGILGELSRRRSGLRPVHTPNSGRFSARLTGIRQTSTDLVLLLDSRVFLEAGALKYVAEEMSLDPAKTTWNGDVLVASEGNRYAGFWHTITFFAWHRYRANRRPTSFGPEDFDYYPKGTTCFLACRRALLDAYENFETHYSDLRFVNDDTSLLRQIVLQQRINISPGFSCTYHARESLREFLGHAQGRGIHFVDGFLTPGNRYFPLLVAFLLGCMALPVLVLAFPVFTGLTAFCFIAAGLPALFAGLRVAGVASRDARLFCLLLPPFLVVYGQGIWRGVFLALKNRLNR